MTQGEFKLVDQPILFSVSTHQIETWHCDEPLQPESDQDPTIV